MLEVSVSATFSKFFWIIWVLASIISLPIFGLGLLLFVIAFWQKKMVINRTKFILEHGIDKVIYIRGSWFVADDDNIPLKAIDNVKISTSVIGKVFGWCSIVIETRSEEYNIHYVKTIEAKQFRETLMQRI